jgi:hypothetical protein
MLLNSSMALLRQVKGVDATEQYMTTNQDGSRGGGKMAWSVPHEEQNSLR